MNDELEVVFLDEVDQLEARSDVTAADKKAAVKQYGDVTYADEANKKYPIDTEEHIRAAWNYINKEANAAKYSDKGAAIKRKVIAAWKDKIDKSGPPSASDNNSMFVMDNYVQVQPGQPYRLFPFGKIIKGGFTHVITPDYAKKFKLPHFKPAIKLGSHEDTTPAGGSISKLEVREDGLYAYPDLTEKGSKALAEGDYKYHSPEVLWDDGVIENPQTGELMSGPFIVGDALLHTPHLGEDAALYSAEIQPLTREDLQMMTHSHNHTHTDGTSHSHSHTHADGMNHDNATHNHSHEGDTNMTAEPMKVTREEWSAFEAFKKLFGGGKQPEPQKAEIDPEKYAALQIEAAAAKSRIDKMEAERAHEREVMSIATQLTADKFGQMFKSDAFRMEAAEVFSSLNDKQREWVMRKFAAFSSQIDYASKIIGQEIGNDQTGPTDPITVFTALITEKQKEEGFKGAKNYNAAVKAVRDEHPDEAAAYNAAMNRRAKE